MTLQNLKHFLLVIPFTISCSNTEKNNLVFLEKGKANITINSYLNAKTNVGFKDNLSLQTVVNFDNSIFVENVLNFNTMFYIKQDSFCIVPDEDFNNKIASFQHISKKPYGMSFAPTDLKGMVKVQEKDTILNNKEHTFLSFEDKTNFKTFYLQNTDSLYSYSLSDSLERSHNAIITNIQIYNKAEDLFTTIYIDYVNELSEKEEQIINFNKYINEQ